jgi:hypothetical protein
MKMSVVFGEIERTRRYVSECEVTSNRSFPGR